MSEHNDFLVRVRGIAKSYPVPGAFWSHSRHQVLRDISFDVRPGESLALLGHSGSGKSTLSRIILGLERPDAGEVLIAGIPVAQWRRENPGAMSVVFQDYQSSANPTWTVERIIREPLRLIGADDPAAVPRLLESVGLPASLSARYPHQLSGGQMQRVAIARAIAAKPRLMIFDEAVSSLDASVQAEILELLASMRHENTTWLFITHDIAAAAAISSRVLFLSGGRIVEDLPVNRLLDATDPTARGLLEAAALPLGIGLAWSDPA